MIEIRTLGELSVSDEGRRVRLATRKHYALLIYLAAHPDRPFLRDRLAALFWGDSPDKRARHSLNQTLYGIRRSIPRLQLQTTMHEVTLAAGGLFADFMALREAVEQKRFRDAVSLYAGEFLDGFYIRGSEEFEQWQERERHTIEQQVLWSLGCLLDTEESEANWQEVEQIAARMLHLDPFNSKARAARISAIARSGNRMRAQVEWRRTHDLYIREFGAVPEELKSHVMEILDEYDAQQVEALDDDSQHVTRFVGRLNVFQRMRDVWRSVRSGEAHVVVVNGEAGIGKTRLCTQLLRLAAIQGARCFEGRCYSTESGIPFSGIMDALANGVLPRDFETIARHSSAALPYLFPRMVERTDGQYQAYTGDEYRRRLFDALARIVEDVSDDSPTAMFIDDFQWADHSTIAVVHYIARRILNRPVLILLALRNDGLIDNPTINQFRTDISKHPRYVEISLSELDEHDARSLISFYCEKHNISLPDEYEGQLIRRVGGRPFFLIELLRAYVEQNEGPTRLGPETSVYAKDSLPKSIKAVLETRLETLGQEEAKIVGALAVLGKGATFDLLTGVTGTSAISASESLENLFRKGIVKESGGEIAFSHDLLREAAYEWIGGYLRRIFHERAGDALASKVQTPPGVLAIHYDLAGKKEKAFAHSMAAADASDRTNSIVETELYLRMALKNIYDDHSKNAIYERLAYFLFMARRHAEALAFFDHLEQCFQRTGNHKGTLIAEVNRISAAFYVGEISAREAVVRLEECVVTAEQIGERELLCTILRRLIEAAHFESDRHLALKWARRIVEVEAASPRTVDTVKNLGVAAMVIGIYESAREGHDLCNSTCEICYELDDEVGLVGTLRARANHRMHLGLLTLAREDYENASALASRIDNYGGQLELWITGALLEAECGRWEEGAMLYDRISEVAQRNNATHALVIARANQLIMEYERGKIDQLNESAHSLIALNRTVANWWCDLTAWSILGLCALGRGDVEEARRCRREVLLRYEGRDFWISDVSYAEIFLARLSSLEGEVEGAVGRLEEAIAAYEDRDVLCRSRMRLERARLLQELDPVESRREAEAVYAAAVEMGARPLVEKAEAVLRRAAGAGRATRVRSAR